MAQQVLKKEKTNTREQAPTSMNANLNGAKKRIFAVIRKHIAKFKEIFFKKINRILNNYLINQYLNI